MCAVLCMLRLCLQGLQELARLIATMADSGESLLEAPNGTHMLHLLEQAEEAVNGRTATGY